MSGQSDSLGLGDDVEIPARTGELLAGLTGDRSACQTTGQVHCPLSASWRGDKREVSKTRLYKYVRRAPEGTPLSKVVRDIFGQDAVDSAGADYKLARRFFSGSDLFKIARRGGSLWVEPTVEAFNLSPQYANRKTSVGRGDGLSNAERQGKTGDSSRTDSQSVSDPAGSPQYPKDRAQSVLEDTSVLDGSNGGHDYRAGLLRQLGTERETQQDKFKIQRAVLDWISPQYLLIPYQTRFNTESRARSSVDRLETALETATERHNSAVVLTLTTDTKRFESVSEAADGLSKAKGRLMSWLATDYQLGHRPDNLSVLEFTEAGLPHLHLVFFGVSWVAPQSQISAKWDDYGQGSVVRVRTVGRRGDKWIIHDDDGGTVTVRQYLGKAADDLVDVAQMDAGELREAAESGDVSYWRQALYWATGRQHVSCSPSLKDSGDSDGLPHVKRYEFVGVAQYRNIPAHVRRDAAILDRPPPPSRQSTASTGSGQSASGTASAVGD